MLDQPTHHARPNEAAPTKYCNTHPAPPSGRLVTARGGNLAHLPARSGGLRPSSREELVVAAGQFAVSSDVRPGALTATAIHSRNRQYGADFGTSASPLGDHVERDREFQHALPHRRLARVTRRERRESDVVRPGCVRRHTQKSSNKRSLLVRRCCGGWIGGGLRRREATRLPPGPRSHGLPRPLESL